MLLHVKALHNVQASHNIVYYQVCYIAAPVKGLSLRSLQPTPLHQLLSRLACALGGLDIMHMLRVANL